MGENIFGPFEAGFDGTNPMQRSVLEGLGCSEEDAATISLPGGIDTQTCEQVIAHACGIELPRVDVAAEGDTFVGLVDSCGGHTREYHFHERLNCLYSQTAGSGHSDAVGTTFDGTQYLYGRNEQK